MAPAIKKLTDKFHLDLSLVTRFSVVPPFSEILQPLHPDTGAQCISFAVTSATVVAWFGSFQPSVLLKIHSTFTSGRLSGLLYDEISMTMNTLLHCLDYNTELKLTENHTSIRPTRCQTKTPSLLCCTSPVSSVKKPAVRCGWPCCSRFTSLERSTFTSGKKEVSSILSRSRRLAVCSRAHSTLRLGRKVGGILSRCRQWEMLSSCTACLRLGRKSGL